MAIANNGGLQPGLYLVATPIGNARDITLRALDVLRDADVLAAEDTRTLRRLMEIHGIALNGRKIVAFHDHNAAQARPRLLDAVQGGASVAYASDAGTPLVADPGYSLVQAMREADLPVTAVPGATAAITALSIAGLPTDRFLFAGFLPAKSTARRGALSALGDVEATLVFYESPHRILATLQDMAEVLGDDREARLCRELTKRFEETRAGTLAHLVQSVADVPPKGELVVLVSGTSGTVREIDIDGELTSLLQHHSVKEAAALLSVSSGLSKRDLYQRALVLKKGQGE